ncbi:MAG: BatD family protein [Caldilineaceae bacterium]
MSKARGSETGFWVKIRFLITCFFVLTVGGGFGLGENNALWAQDNPVTAQVDRTTIGSNETVTLSVIINGGSGDQPQLPTLDGFQVLSMSSASQFSMINGKTSSQISYQYILQPTRTGDLAIPAITVLVNGQAYQTTPLTVQVMQGAAPSRPNGGGQATPAPNGLNNGIDNGALFVEGSVDQPTIYLGQQVTYAFRFYQAVNLFDQPSYQPPDYTGFWHEQKSSQTQSQTNRNGRTYQVTTLETILFPTIPGVQTISPATLTIPGSLFQRGTVLQTDPVTVTVTSLPQPQPTDFSGAVGRLTITATVSANTVAVNEPVTLRVILQGEGNAANWPDPAVPDLPGWRKFDSTTKTDSQVQNGRLVGTRTYEQLLVPTVAGPASIPALTYTYFDPEQGAYARGQTPAFDFTINAAAAEAPIPTVAANAQAPVTLLGSDIRYIKQAPTVLRTAVQPLTSQPLYWGAWGVPLLLVVVDGLWRGRRQRQAQDPVHLRHSQAQRKARRALAQARKIAGDPHPVVAQVLTDYLSAKLNQPVAGLTQSMLTERLHKQGLDNALVTEVNQLLVLSEIGRFAPAGPNGADDNALLTETEQLINRLEKVL